MNGVSSLRRGRSLTSRTKKAHSRRKQPRFFGNGQRPLFKAAPRKPRPSQPYLGSGVDIESLLG